MEQEVLEEKKASKRDALLARIKQNNPDYEPADDEDLYGQIDEMYNSTNSELEGHRSANKNLAGLVGKDPRFGGVLSMVKEGKSYPYAHAKMYGKEALELEDEDLEKWEEGYQENLAALAESEQLQIQAQENFTESMSRLKAYCDKNGHDETRYNELLQSITQYAEDMLMGKISDSLFAEVDKGQTYDEDIQEAAETGKVEGMNQKIDMKLEKPSTVPDMGSKTVMKSNVKMPAKGSFYDAVKKA